MLNKTSNGLFNISKFDIVGSHIEKNSIGISLSATTYVRPITLLEIASAIEECFSEYDVNSPELAPTIYFIVMINNSRSYEFKVNLKLDFVDYVITIARQIKL